MRSRYLFIPILLTGCSGGILPSSAKRESTAVVRTAQNSAQTTSSTLDPRKTYEKLLQLKLQNDALCVRVQKQRVECPASNPLAAGEGDKVLGCVAGVDSKATVGVDFRISVEPPPGYNVYLSTPGDAWQTNEVGVGDNQKLVFGPRKARTCDGSAGVNSAIAKNQMRAPKLFELNSLLLNFVPHDQSKCDNSRKPRAQDVGKFDVFVNGELIISKNQIKSDDTGSQIDLSTLDQKLNNPKCIISQDEFDTILDRALDNYEKPLSNEKLPSTLDEDYSRETSRNQVMQLELTGSAKLGCWANAKIEKLEVRIEGSALGARSVESEAGGRRGDEGSPSGFRFNFGQGISHAVSEERGIFKPGGGFVTDAFSDRTIQELRLMSIKKLGTSYDHQEFKKSRGCGFLGWSTCYDSKFRISETNRRSMSAIKILVNDQLIYENNNASHVFEGGSLKWPEGDKDINIQDNPKFRELMRQTSCPAG